MSKEGGLANERSHRRTCLAAVLAAPYIAASATCGAIAAAYFTGIQLDNALASAVFLSDWAFAAAGAAAAVLLIDPAPAGRRWRAVAAAAYGAAFYLPAFWLVWFTIQSAWRRFT